MDPIRKNLLEALNFSAGEKRGLLFLAILTLLFCFLPEVLIETFVEIDDSTVEASYIEFMGRTASSDNKEQTAFNEVRDYFNFDPNSISPEEMEVLGFPAYLITRIEKYRQAGGKFRSKVDMKKIYGMKSEFYNSLEPFIKIPEESTKPPKVDRMSVKSEIDLNRSDSAAFISLKGIGPVFAHRIVAYRAALGGFVDIEQLKEVYGFKDSLFSSLKGLLRLDTLNSVRKIDINTVSLDGLKKHPYFRNHQLSNALVNYRKMHGNYLTFKDLKKVHLMNDSILNKIKPYLSIQ